RTRARSSVVRFIRAASVSHSPAGSKQKCGRGFCAPTSVYGIQPARRLRVLGGGTGTTACVTFCGWVKDAPLRKSGGEMRTNMKYGLRRAHASACCFVSKKRSITIALRSAAVRPESRAAFRERTADPVSTATKVPSDKITLLPYGTRRGSTAQWPARKRAPVEQTCRRVQGSDPLPPLAQYTVTRARIDCSRAKTGGAKNRMAVSKMKTLFI